MDILNSLGQCGIVPVIKINDEKNAVPLAKAIFSGGVSFAEVTFRTPCAANAIKLMSKNAPQLIVGAGTILNKRQAEQAIEAGAKFIVSPGFDSETVRYCKSVNMPIFPGCVTPTEIMAVISEGLSVVKFFPADLYGGLAGIKALSAPFANIRFIPTGGVSLDNLSEFISFNKIIACGGSFITPEKLIDAGDFSAIEELCKKSREIISEVRK